MCTGHLDPKLVTREVEARLAGWPKRQANETKPGLPRDPINWIVTLAGWLTGKEATHG